MFVSWNSRFDLQMGTKQVPKLTLTETNLYGNLIGCSELVVLIEAGKEGCVLWEGKAREERRSPWERWVCAAGGTGHGGGERRHLLAMPGPGPGAAKRVWGIGPKESGDGKVASNPLGLLVKCGNNLFTDAHSLDSCAAWLLTSQPLFFQVFCHRLGPHGTESCLEELSF